MKISVILEALTGSFDTDIDRSTKRAQRRFEDFQRQAGAAFRVVATAAAAAAAGIGLLVRSQIQAADRFAKLSQSTGLAIDTLATLELAAELAGSSFDDFVKATTRLARSASDAQHGLQTQLRAFNALGIQVVDSGGKLKSVEQLLFEVADAFAGMEDGTKKAAVAQELLGRSGAGLIPLLNEGRAGIEAVRKEAEALGLILDSETAAAAERVDDNFTRLSFAVRGFGRQIAVEVLPVLELLTDEMVESAKRGGLLRDVADGIGNTFKFVVTSASGAAFVVRELGDSLGAMAAQATAIMRLDFEQAQRIGEDFQRQQEERAEKFVARIAAIWGRVSGPARPQRIGEPEGNDEGGEKARAKLESDLDRIATGFSEATAAQSAFERDLVVLQDALEGGLIDEREFSALAASLKEQFWDKIKKDAEETTSTMGVFAEQAARNMQDAFADFLFDPFDQGLDGMLKSFARALQRMAAEAAAAQIFKQIGTSFSGSDNTLLAAIGTFFAGASGKQHGGPVQAGRPYVVGEKEPELFIPNSSGTIIPSLRGAGQSVSVVYNVDARNAQDPALIVRAMERTRQQSMSDFAELFGRNVIEARS